MKVRLPILYRGLNSSNDLCKGLLPCMAETFRTHGGWSLLPKYTAPFSSMGNALEFVNDKETERGKPLQPTSISNMNLHVHPFLPFLEDQSISSKGFLPSMAETFKTQKNWPLRLKNNVPFRSMGDFVDDEEIQEGRPVKPISISDKDLQLPSFLEDKHISSKLEKCLPSMAETFKTKDWSLLQKFSSMDSKLNIEEALESELSAICVWFLFTKVPPHVKEVVARTLAFISLGTSMSTKMSFDQTGVENLVVRILRSGDTQAQRQLCLALSVLASCPSGNLDVTFGAGIQDQLIQLVRNCNPELTYPVLSAVVSISLSTKGMREKIVKTELLDFWLVKLLRRNGDDSIIYEAVRMVACIAGERCDGELWDHVKENLLPPIFGLYYNRHQNDLLRDVVQAILKITEYGSSDQIDDLVEVDGLKFLFKVCSRNVYFARECFSAIENILRAGEAKAKAGDEDEDRDRDEDELENEYLGYKVKVKNEYAAMIDDYLHGWDEICRYVESWDSTGDEAVSLLEKYGPDPIPRYYCFNWHEW